MRALLILVLVSGSAVAAPVFTQGPERVFNCTHYLDGMAAYLQPIEVKPGDAMGLHLPVDKLVKFNLAAKGKGKVTFSIDHAPPGAKLSGNTFTWKAAGAPSQSYDFALIATDGTGATRWDITIQIADDDLFTAWSAGYGSVWPACDVYPGDVEVKDLDGDGRKDVIFKTLAGIQDGRNLSYMHVMIQHGAKYKFVEAMSCDFGCTVEGYVTSDGTSIVVNVTECCMRKDLSIVRIDDDGPHDAGSQGMAFQVDGGGTDLSEQYSFDKDAKGHVTALVLTRDGQKPRKLPWDKATKTFH